MSVCSVLLMCMGRCPSNTSQIHHAAAGQAKPKTSLCVCRVLLLCMSRCTGRPSQTNVCVQCALDVHGPLPEQYKPNPPRRGRPSQTKDVVVCMPCALAVHEPLHRQAK